jgi:hypothetical protein
VELDQERHDHQEHDEHEGPDPGAGPSPASATIAASGIATAAGAETPWIVAVTVTAAVAAPVAAGMTAAASSSSIMQGKAGSAYRETIHGTSIPFFGNTARRNRADGVWKPGTIFGVHLSETEIRT